MSHYFQYNTKATSIEPDFYIRKNIKQVLPNKHTISSATTDNAVRSPKIYNYGW
jgi:hypothetical protein